MLSPLDLERVYDTHAQAVFSFLLSIVRNDADARDLLQELFVKLARRPHLLDGVREERAYLLRLAHNSAVDLIRRRGAREKSGEQVSIEAPLLFAATPDPDEQAFREALSRALRELPPDQRTVVHLKLWEGMTFESIADLLEIPLNTAASRYRYGLDKMRERLRLLYDEIK
jgi:RNA polymerase sigma-70 factor (ECF subfamily)